MVTLSQFQSDYMYKRYGNGRDRKEFENDQSWSEQMSVNDAWYIAREYAELVREEAANICDAWENSGELGTEIRNIKIN